MMSAATELQQALESVAESPATGASLLPYVPRLVTGWSRDEPDVRWKAVDGTLAFIDISGFTSMTERLARKGKVGAEEMNDVLNALFTELLTVAYDDDAGLVKWGGDAGLLLFDGPDHAGRACRAAINMQSTIRRVGRITTSAGQVRLRMSIGMHSGEFDFYLVGDPKVHRELVLAGPATTTTVLMEQTAEAGEVAVSEATAALINGSVLGPRKDDAILLRAAPEVPLGSGRRGSTTDGVDLAGLIPVAIRERLLTGEEQPEHRRITAAFLEFVGSDDFCAREGPEALGEAVDACVRVIQRETLRHGVSFFETDVARNAWRVMLIAGAPRSLGDDEDRMLATLRAIVETDLPLPVRMGTNGGHVFAGHFGPPFRRTYSVKGDAVNTAARIMAKAEPGSIYASASVLDPASALYEMVELEPFAAKGKRRPLQAWSVGRRSGSKTGDLELPLVGRERELEAFSEATVDALNGRGSAIGLVGPPGIGKTRMLAELTRTAQGFCLLRALCEPYQQQIAYRPFRAVLRSALDIPKGAPNEEAAQRLREKVEDLAPDLVPWLHLLGIVGDIELPSTREVDDLGEDFKRNKLEEVTVRFLSLLLTEPTLLTFEDVHWIDEGSAALLARLSEQVGSLPWVLAVTRRPETSGFVLEDRERCRTLLLQPLAPDEAERLIATATEANPLRRHDAQALAERSAGNPLFLSQLLLAAVRTGSVGELPPSVEALATEQVDRLPLADRRVLRFAAVLGIAFDEDLVWSLLRPEEHLPDSDAWTRLADFLEEAGPGRRRFRHALMREAAYEGLPFRRRRDLHARAGVMIIADADDPAEVAELLSHHFFAAHNHFDAWAYSVIAGGRARAKYGNADAAVFYARAIESGRRSSHVSAADLAAVHEELGDVRLTLNEFEAARAAYAAGRRLVSDDPIALGRFLLQEAKTHYRGGRSADAIRLIRRGMRLLEDERSSEARKAYARLAALYAGTRVSQGRYAEAEIWCRRIIDESDEVGEPEALARAHYILDFALMEQGRVEEAVFSARAAELYAQLGDLSNESEVISNSGVYAYSQGSWTEAFELYERSLDLRRRLGDDAEAGIVAANMAELRLDQGRLDEAEALLAQAGRAFHAGGYLVAQGYLAELLGRAAAQAGRLSQALEEFATAMAIFERTGYRSHVFETHMRIAEALVLAGQPDPALEEVDKAFVVAAELGGIPAKLPLLHRIHAFALTRLGRIDEARAALELSLETARARRAHHEVGLTLDALVKLDRSMGREPDPALVEESGSILAQLDLVDSAKPAVFVAVSAA